MLLTILMTMIQVFFSFLAIGFLTLIIFIYRIKTSIINRLADQLPGPRPYFPLGNLWTFVTAKRHEIYARAEDLGKPYQNNAIFRIWYCIFPHIFLVKAPAIEAVLGSSKQTQKANPYKFLHSWLGKGILTSSGDQWRFQRKLITPSFHFRILENYVSIFNEQADILVDILSQLEDKGQFDIYPYLTRCTLDIIVETAMGVQTIRSQTDADSEYFNAVETISEMITLRIFKPWLVPDVIFNLTSYGRTQAKCIKILHGFTRKVIQERKAKRLNNKKFQVESDDVDSGIYGTKRRLAFLDLLLESTCDGQKLTESEVADQVETIMFGGHDTTATAATWILYNIGRFPEIQANVNQELDAIFGNSDRPVSSEDLHKMKYLERVIKESLRLFSPPVLFARNLSEDVQIGEHLLPAGVLISFSLPSIHRDPDNFPDPEKFDPDRFLPENSVNRHPYAYLPFSAGPRNCIGQKFAMMELKIIISKIVRRFRVTSMQKLEDLIFLPELVLRPYKGLWLKLEKRQEILN